MATRLKTRLSVLYDVHVLAGLSNELVEGALVDAELNGPEFAFYSLLKAEGPLTTTEAAEWSAMPLASASKLITRLERRGHVTRVGNPADGRSTLVELSPAGRRAHEEAKAGFGRMLRRLRAELGTAEDEVRWALERLETAMRACQQHGTDAAPPPKPAEYQLSYAGQPLTAEEERSARDHIAWLLWRRHR